jgi:hypothetical protein
MVERESLKTILEIVGIWIVATGVVVTIDFSSIYKIVISGIAGIILIIYGVAYFHIKDTKEIEKEITSLKLKLQETNFQEPCVKEKIQTDERINKSTLLPDTNEITKLNVTNVLLDEIYEKAHSQATKTNGDVKLSRLSIGVFPFDLSSKIYIYMTFYSKWINRTYEFKFDDRAKEIKHSLPDERAISYIDRAVFAKVPWQKNPQWRQFLELSYAKVRSLPVSEDATYTLDASAYAKMPWAVIFNDGFGNPHIYRWNGKGLDESSIVADAEK